MGWDGRGEENTSMTFLLSLHHRADEMTGLRNESEKDRETERERNIKSHCVVKYLIYLVYIYIK